MLWFDLLSKYSSRSYRIHFIILNSIKCIWILNHDLHSLIVSFRDFTLHRIATIWEELFADSIIHIELITNPDEQAARGILTYLGDF